MRAAAVRLQLIERSCHLIAALHVSTPSRHCCCNCLLISRWDVAQMSEPFLANATVIFDRAQLQLSGPLLNCLIRCSYFSSIHFDFASDRKSFSGWSGWQHSQELSVECLVPPRGCMLCLSPKTTNGLLTGEKAYLCQERSYQCLCFWGRLAVGNSMLMSWIASRSSLNHSFAGR